MELRTSEEMPELSIWGTPLRLTTTLRPPRCTTDWSASVSCSLGSPMVRRPWTASKWTPFDSRTEISMGRRSVIGRSLSWNCDATLPEEITFENAPSGYYWWSSQGNNTGPPARPTKRGAALVRSVRRRALYDDGGRAQVARASGGRHPWAAAGAAIERDGRSRPGDRSRTWLQQLSSEKRIR